MRRWISSTKKTLLGSSAVSSAAMSPLRSSAGPAVCTKRTPSSSATICASDVLPSPGGPESRTWSSASPRPAAASTETVELLADAVLADELVERAGTQRAVEVLLAVERAGRLDPGRLGHPWAALSALASSSSAVEPSAPVEQLLGLGGREPELEQAVAGDDAAGRRRA